MKYAWITKHRDQYPVTTMCRALGVSKSGYYKSQKAKTSSRSARTQRIIESVKLVFHKFDSIYGSYKVAEVMAEDEMLESACRNTVAKVMQKLGLKSRVSRKFKPRTTVIDGQKRPAENLLDQDFSATKPNERWVADITYISTRNGTAYLAAVLDLFSRKVVGWAVSENMKTTLVCRALQNALQTRRPSKGSLIHHSDRGCQYTSDDFQRLLTEHSITCSMSSTGCCYDNAAMERFFWSLKNEWTKHENYRNIDDVRQSVFRYIETFYNNHRLHQTLGYQSPSQFEQSYNHGVAI